MSNMNQVPPMPGNYQPSPGNIPPMPGQGIPPVMNTMTKNEYLKKHASPTAKKALKVAFVAFCVAAVLALITVFLSVNTAIYEIPAIEFFAEMSGEDDAIDSLKEIFDDAADSIDSLKAEYKLIKNNLSKKERDAAKAIIETMRDFGKKPSIKNFVNAINTTEKSMKTLENSSLGDYDYESSDFAELSVLNIFYYVLLIYGLLILLITVLAFYLKKGGLSILAIILSLGYYLSFAGLFLTIIFIAANVVHIVYMNKIKREYIAYSAMAPHIN